MSEAIDRERVAREKGLADYARRLERDVLALPGGGREGPCLRTFTLTISMRADRIMDAGKRGKLVEAEGRRLGIEVPPGAARAFILALGLVIPYLYWRDHPDSTMPAQPERELEQWEWIEAYVPQYAEAHAPAGLRQRSAIEREILRGVVAELAGILAFLPTRPVRTHELLGHCGLDPERVHLVLAALQRRFGVTVEPWDIRDWNRATIGDLCRRVESYLEAA